MKNEGTAIVTRSSGSSYTLRDIYSNESIEARLRGKIRLRGIRSTNPIAVGDKVRYESTAENEAAIVEILPRTNYIIRRSPNLSKESHIMGANLDQAALVVTLFHPVTNFEFIDRFLVTCEAYEIPAILVLNKSDILVDFPDAVEMFRHIYGNAGYNIIEISAQQGSNLEALKLLLRDKTTLLSGNSGVGKSTLISKLIPGVEIQTAEISDYHHKGRHTTTFASMYSLPEGGYVIDTPGIKGFGLIDIGGKELYQFFPELMKYSTECQFYNCTHVHEPGCAVQEAVVKGYITESRYISYLKILEEDEKYRK